MFRKGLDLFLLKLVRVNDREQNHKDHLKQVHLFAVNQSKKQNVPRVTILPKTWAFAAAFIMVRGACMNTDSLCVSASVR